MNPYEVLGVDTTATDEQIKSAYRVLAQKYSDVSYNDSSLKDIAKIKMDELNNAYDQIMLGRTSVSSTSYDEHYNTSSNDYTSHKTTSQYGDIRAKINSGRIDDAETLLDGVPKIKRDAEWYFLKGTVMQRRGWFDEASRNFNTAYSMEPENMEYKAARDNCEFNKQGKFNNGTDNNVCGCSPCSLCSTLMLADCCCSAFRCCGR